MSVESESGFHFRCANVNANVNANANVTENVNTPVQKAEIFSLLAWPVAGLPAAD